MLKLDTRIDLDLTKFLNWWGGELSFLVPRQLLNLLGKNRSQLVITRTNGTVQAYLAGESSVRAIAEFPLDDGAQGRRQQLFADHPELEEIDLVLLLGPGQSLTKTFKLPAVAEENLKQVASFEMDRLTPFKADQVYFDVKILERLKDTRQIRVELALTPRGRLDLLLDELAASGWLPGRVDVGDGKLGMGYDLLPDKFRRPQKRLPKILAITSFTLLFSLLLALLGLPILMNFLLLDDLQKEVKAVGKIAQEVQSLRENTEKLANESGFLLHKKRREPVMIDMLDELTKVIPDDTSLNGLQYRDRKVTIQGESPAASSLIERIEASHYFKNTSFVSPVTKDISSGNERFQISSEVVNGRFSDQRTE